MVMLSRQGNSVRHDVEVVPARHVGRPSAARPAIRFLFGTSGRDIAKDVACHIAVRGSCSNENCHHVAACNRPLVGFGTTGRRSSPRANAGRLVASRLSGSFPKYESVCIKADLTAGSIFAQMSQQTRTSRPSAIQTAELASQPALTRARMIAVPMTLCVR